jgi:hypothetical protein
VPRESCSEPQARAALPRITRLMALQDVAGWQSNIAFDGGLCLFNKAYRFAAA